MYPGAYHDIAEQEKTPERRRSTRKNDKTTHDARVLYKYNKVRHWGMFRPHVKADRVGTLIGKVAKAITLPTSLLLSIVRGTY